MVWQLRRNLMATTSLYIYGNGGHAKVVADIARANGYENLIFLDDKIADENIFKVIKTLEKNCNRKIILVGLTSDTINKTKNYFINNGYDDYLSMPIDIVALNKLLEKYLNQNNK